MAIEFKTSGVPHFALRSTNIERSKRFYIETLGFQAILEAANLFIFLAGTTAIAVRGPEPATPQDDISR
jgi:glyoxylase I family protein